MGNPGYIYALINPALEGLVKVGKTTTNPDKRANELSSATGVPMQFMVAYSTLVSDCDLAEKYAHGILEKNGYRVSSNREFFQAPLSVAIDTIKSTANFIGTITESELTACYKSSEMDNYFDNSAWADLEREADAFFINSPWIPMDKDKAISLYTKAAEAGCVRAYYQLGKIHLLIASMATDNPPSFFQKFFGGDNTNKKHIHFSRGLEAHRIALKNGYELSYAALASYFGENGNTAEAKKYWELFFQSNAFRNRIDPDNEIMSLYLTCYSNYLYENLKIDYNEANFHANQKFDV